MGMDVYGLNPKRNTAKPEILTEYLDDEGWTDWERLKRNNTVNEEGEEVMSEEYEAYWEAHHQWEEDNPGRYFRNNVWWWRPLWNYVCFICDDILDEEDQNNGHGNGGHQINEKKAEVIASRLNLYIENGEAEYFAKERQVALDAEPDEDCEYCNATGKRDDEYVKGECNGCQGKGTRRPWDNNYPFDVDNLKEFAKFCEQSGGFEIC